MDMDVHEKFRELTEQIAGLAEKIVEYGQKSQSGELNKHEVMVELDELKSKLKALEEAKTVRLPAAKKKRVVKKKKSTVKTTNE